MMTSEERILTTTCIVGGVLLVICGGIIIAQIKLNKKVNNINDVMADMDKRVSTVESAVTENTAFRKNAVEAMQKAKADTLAAQNAALVVQPQQPAAPQIAAPQIDMNAIIQAAVKQVMAEQAAQAAQQPQNP